MTAYNILGWLMIIGWALLIWHCPIMKPWFGFRKPKDHPGKWWT